MEIKNQVTSLGLARELKEADTRAKLWLYLKKEGLI